MLKKSLKEIANLLYCSLSNEEEITHVAFDSREVKKSSLFFAIKGAKVDGHQFLEEVARRGALGAVVEKSYRGPHFGLSLLFVDEVKGALQQLAQVVHQEGTPFVIGVTGTIGKTTTKEFIATLLREKVSVYATPGNANSQLSLPVTLLNRKEKAEVLVLEMGMSLPGELRRLTEIAPPDLGVLTKLTLVHGDSFNSLEEIAEAKKELFEAQSVKRAILNKQTTAFTPIQKIQLPTTFYSVNDPEADLFLYVEKERVFVQEKRA
ncbi:MAG: hypothetical protein HYZ47_05075 [Simkania negevensis]|nr:hypothetical protein [Simkania negevensis]